MRGYKGHGKQAAGRRGWIDFFVSEREKEKNLNICLSALLQMYVNTADINKCIFTASDLFMVDMDSQMSCKFAKHNVTLKITASLCHVIF